MAKTKRMAFGGMGAMPARPGPAVRPQMPPPTQTQARNQMQSPMRPQQAGVLGTQTGGPVGMQRAQMPAPSQQSNQGMAIAQQQMAQMLRARQQAPGVGTQTSGPIGQQRAQMPPSQSSLQGMAQMGPGTQTGGAGQMGMPPPNAARVGMFKKGGAVKKCADGGLTYAERKALMDEKVAPPKGSTKKNADIFRQGMKPPMDDDMGSAQPGQPGQPAKKKAKGGSIKASKMGAVKVSKPTMRSASSRADGIAIRGKTRA